jgi:hypothetical protein
MSYKNMSYNRVSPYISEAVTKVQKKKLCILRKMEEEENLIAILA